jgi:apolipoprotein D and lipocalin family protein
MSSGSLFDLPLTFHERDRRALPGVKKTMTTLALFVAALALAQDAPPKTVPSVDLQRYAGQWFEIARFPNRFQRDCSGDVVVSYTVRPDGRLNVDNRCRKTDGSTDRAAGVARLATDDGSNSKLEVRFAPAWLSFLPAVWGDYWIVGLDAGYQLAVVGSPNREYLWVLSRNPAPPEADLTRMIEIARAQGFDVTRLERTSQSGQVPQAK